MCALLSRPMPYRLQFADWVPVPTPRVFAFFSNPENLPRLMPPETAAKINGFQLFSPPLLPDQDAITTHHAAGTGSIIETSFRPFRWISWRRQCPAVITEFEWNDPFADVQQKGPFKHWHHRHEFLPESHNGFNGTLVRDLIEYEVGFGPLGGLANSLFIEHGIRQIFKRRQKVLPGFCPKTNRPQTPQNRCTLRPFIQRRFPGGYYASEPGQDLARMFRGRCRLVGVELSCGALRHYRCALCGGAKCRVVFENAPLSLLRGPVDCAPFYSGDRGRASVCMGASRPGSRSRDRAEDRFCGGLSRRLSGKLRASHMVRGRPRPTLWLDD